MVMDEGAHNPPVSVNTPTLDWVDGLLRPGPVTWFGGKGHLAAWIVEHLPESKVYVEPYGGAASVLMAKEPSPIEVYNDIHGDLVNLFRCLRDPDRFPALKQAMTLTLHSRGEFEEAVDYLADGTDEDRRAAAFFIAMNQGYGGTYPTRGRWGRSKGERMSGGMGNNTSQWWRRVAWLDWWHERLARVQVENRDALALIGEFDSADTTFYIDPPYPTELRKSSLNAYKHEVDEAHHVAMVERLLTIEGQAVLSGYDTPLYTPLEAAGWQVVTKTAHARGAGNAGGKKRVEVLWVKRHDPTPAQVPGGSGHGSQPLDYGEIPAPTPNHSTQQRITNESEPSTETSTGTASEKTDRG